jgi:hypothetical protein
MYTYWQDEQKFKQRLEEVLNNAGSYNVQCGTKAIMATGILTNAINFTYRETYKNLLDQSSSDANRIRQLLTDINESISQEEDAVQYLIQISQIFRNHSEHPSYCDFFCQSDIEFYCGRTFEDREEYNQAKDSGVPILVGLNPNNYHYVVLVQNPCTKTQWIINPKQSYREGSVYRLSSSSDTIGSRYGVYRYKSTKGLVPVERYWLLPPGTVDYECWLRRETQVLRAKLYPNTDTERGIIGVYANVESANAEKVRDNAWKQKDANGQETGYYECWLNKSVPTEAVHLKMHRKEGKVGLIGVFETSESAANEAELGSYPWMKERS